MCLITFNYGPLRDIYICHGYADNLVIDRTNCTGINLDPESGQWTRRAFGKHFLKYFFKGIKYKYMHGLYCMIIWLYCKYMCKLYFTIEKINPGTIFVIFEHIEQTNIYFPTSKQEELKQGWFKVEPPSLTLAQH